MKLFKRLLILIVAFLVLFFVSVSVFVKIYGKNFVEKILKNTLDREVSVEKVSYQFPLSLRLNNIRIAHLIEGKKFFEAQSIAARLSIDAILRQELVFDYVTIIKPVVIIEKITTRQESSDRPIRRHGVVIPPNQEGSAGVDKISDADESEKQFGISIKNIILSQGRFQYANSSIDKDFSFSMEDIYLKAQHLAFPFKMGQTKFDVSGRLIKKGNPLSGSSVEGHGWVDIVKRDMEVKIEIIEADGSVGMTAEAISKDNDMEVKGEIKFQNILMGIGKGDSSDISVVNNLISSTLSTAGIEIGAKFSFKTKMDDFRPEQVSFSGNVVTR